MILASQLVIIYPYMNRQRLLVIIFIIIISALLVNEVFGADISATSDMEYKKSEDKSQGTTSTTNQFSQNYSVKYQQQLISFLKLIIVFLTGLVLEAS